MYIHVKKGREIMFTLKNSLLVICIWLMEMYNMSIGAYLRPCELVKAPEKCRKSYFIKHYRLIILRKGITESFITFGILLKAHLLMVSSSLIPGPCHSKHPHPSYEPSKIYQHILKLFAIQLNYWKEINKAVLRYIIQSVHRPGYYNTICWDGIDDGMRHHFLEGYLLPNSPILQQLHQ